MADEIQLDEVAYAVWQSVREHGPIELGEVVRRTGLDQSQVSAAATEAVQQGFMIVDESDREELIVSDTAAAVLERGLPERHALNLLRPIGSMTMPQFIDWAKAEGVAVNEVIKWGGARGWIERAKKQGGAEVALTEAGRGAGNSSDSDERAIEFATKKGGRIFLDELPGAGIDDIDRVRSLLSNRPELAKIKKRTQRVLKPVMSGSGQLRAPAGKLSGTGVIYRRKPYTRDELERGDHKDPRRAPFEPYDVTLAAKDIYPAKIHPLRKIIEQTRRAFLEMGFAEVASPMIESAFWNFDALFQPQDHPARDMQDTFYMRHPAEAPLRPPSAGQPDIVEQVRRTHEDGWETGSEGWGYTWSPERSKQVVLRTHTTAATIRALAANPNPPGKFFCVGWTYRNETISFKHLPVFHQVDGIVVDEEANLASLMGTLEEFYTKMGFGRVKFKPAFYPYTEPSVDVVVYMESRGKWLEMGGAGIFRPEVTLPLGCTYPVLAWGLGIERLAMLRFGLSDIRDLYRANLDALEEVPLCR